MLKIGLISNWHVHAQGYAQQLKKRADVKITAVWSEDEQKGRLWAKELDTRFFADYDTFLASQLFSAVICCAPTTSHFTLMSKAATAKKHIFTEKVFTANSDNAAYLARRVHNARINFTISMPCKVEPYFLYAKALLESGKLGTISAARCRRSHGGLSDGWLPAYWLDPTQSAGGAMMDLGAHPMYILAALFGKPQRLTALMVGASSKTDENAIALAEFENGVLGTMETGFNTHGVPDQLEIFGSSGSFFLFGNAIRTNIKGEGPREIDPADYPPAGFSPLDQFCDALIKGTPTPNGMGLEDAVLLTKMIERAYKANITGLVRRARQTAAHTTHDT
jgi:predicted dehydrogenase